MERRTFVLTSGILAAALASLWISLQASAGKPSGIRNEDDGWANVEIMPNESAEATVTVVAKTVSSTRPGGSHQGSLGVGFGMTRAPLEPLPLSNRKADSNHIATRAPTVTVSASGRDAVRLSWLRLPVTRRRLRPNRRRRSHKSYPGCGCPGCGAKRRREGRLPTDRWTG
jgi:hypothetical protein